MLEKLVTDIAASVKFFLEKERVESHRFPVRQIYILGIYILWDLDEKCLGRWEIRFTHDVQF